MTVLDEVASYIEASSVGIVGTDIFKSRMPDTPDTALALVEYSGAPGSYIQEQPTATWDKPRLQISARAVAYSDAQTMIEAAYRAVDSIRNATLSGVRYLTGMPLQAPFLLKRDEQERTVMCFNAEFWRVL